MNKVLVGICLISLGIVSALSFQVWKGKSQAQETPEITQDPWPKNFIYHPARDPRKNTVDLTREIEPVPMTRVPKDWESFEEKEEILSFEVQGAHKGEMYFSLNSEKNYRSATCKTIRVNLEKVPIFSRMNPKKFLGMKVTAKGMSSRPGSVTIEKLENIQVH